MNTLSKRTTRVTNYSKPYTQTPSDAGDFKCFLFFFITLSLELTDTQVYEP